MLVDEINLYSKIYCFYEYICRNSLKLYLCIMPYLNAYVNKTYNNRHFKWDTFRVIILTCQEFLLLQYHTFFPILFMYIPDMLFALVNSPRKQRLLQNLIIEFLISTISENRTENGYNLEKHQNGNKSQKTPSMCIYACISFC